MLNSNKAYTFKNIPLKILKESRECCSNILQNLLNNTLSNKEFPDELKLTDVTPIHKKEYWVGVQRGQSYLMGRKCLFSLGWPPF